MIQHGKAPFLECSSKGDIRFSAFGAKIKSRGGRKIEDIYQGAKVFEGGITNLDWRSAKGKRAVNQAEVNVLYSKLWDEYIQENPELLPILTGASGLQDMFGQKGSACQATELWRIRCEALGLSANATLSADTHDLFSVPDQPLAPSAGIDFKKPLFDTDGGEYSFVARSPTEIVTVSNGQFIVWHRETGNCKHGDAMGKRLTNNPPATAPTATQVQSLAIDSLHPSGRAGFSRIKP